MSGEEGVSFFIGLFCRKKGRFGVGVTVRQSCGRSGEFDFAQVFNRQKVLAVAEEKNTSMEKVPGCTRKFVKGGHSVEKETG